MNGPRSGGSPDDNESGSWASETLPMSVRKELLERELKNLGFRKAEAARAAGAATGGPSGQQDAASSHPQADGDGEHGG